MIVRQPRRPPLRARIVGSGIPQLAVPWLAVVALSEVLALTGEPVEGLSALSSVLTPVGIALSIFLGFRNNACYERWWEGRRLWGLLVNTVRNLARLLATVPTGDDAGALRAWQDTTTRMLVAWTHALKDQLRTTAPEQDLAPWLNPDVLDRLRRRASMPFALLEELSRQLLVARERGWLHPLHVPLLEGELGKLSDIQGGCERIKNTPVPYAYTAHTHRIVAAYLLAVPFAVLPIAGWAAPVVTGLVAFAFLGLDAVGTEMEDPFETDPNDLPLAAITRVIEIDLHQLLGDAEVPERLQPVGGLLA
jgi:putative membrane protein